MSSPDSQTVAEVVDGVHRTECPTETESRPRQTLRGEGTRETHPEEFESPRGGVDPKDPRPRTGHCGRSEKHLSMTRG